MPLAIVPLACDGVVCALEKHCTVPYQYFCSFRPRQVHTSNVPYTYSKKYLTAPTIPYRRWLSRAFPFACTLLARNAPVIAPLEAFFIPSFPTRFEQGRERINHPFFLGVSLVSHLTNTCPN